MIKEEGKLKYKSEDGQVIETPVLGIFPFAALLDILTIQDNKFVKYCYDTENNKWYKYKPDPEDEHDMITEPCQEEIVDFYFTTKLV
jgi:hypothetical protein